jgi:hypothetical protein
MIEPAHATIADVVRKAHSPAIPPAPGLAINQIVELLAAA